MEVDAMKHIREAEFKGKRIFAVPIEDVRKAVGSAISICKPCPLRGTKSCAQDEYRCMTGTDESFVWIPQETYVAWRLEG
jgi:hypothetical protein